ncbi:hypothetical protein LCER1_G007609 [Lachnellula cervina]|uniref:Uncharacterized protein n=1 Tax=Lachnellula cervina TaxID=1316786 RepID=A0A7D8YPS2_9HELO|nr:hypothetical protein LCER1_G007609 [Lachnellula cervina]
MDHLDRGLNYIALDLKTAKLFIFIGFKVIIANKKSSTKSKRITRSVLALEIYGMVRGINILYIIAIIIDIPPILTIVYTDLYLLYKCLIKLGTTKEKRLIINIIALRQLYKNRELIEIRWINSNNNPVDAIIKSNCNKALKTFINTNKLCIRVEG